MNTNELFGTALLSEAAYADLTGKYSPEDVKKALIAKGLSQTQAADFVTQWRVVDHKSMGSESMIPK